VFVVSFFSIYFGASVTTNLILQAVKERQKGSYDKDLLQMVLEGAKSSDLIQEATDRFVTDNCKNIYLAGLV
jgi:hypothetical protein